MRPAPPRWRDRSPSGRVRAVTLIEHDGSDCTGGQELGFHRSATEVFCNMTLALSPIKHAAARGGKIQCTFETVEDQVAALGPPATLPKGSERQRVSSIAGRIEMPVDAERGGLCIPNPGTAGTHQAIKLDARWTLCCEFPDPHQVIELLDRELPRTIRYQPAASPVRPKPCSGMNPSCETPIQLS